MSAGKAYLEYFLDDKLIKVKLKPKGEWMIGRAPSCAVSLPFPEVSRYHARLIPQEGSWVVVDLDSANGILVNDKEVSSHILQPGDQLEVGPVTMTFLAKTQEPPVVIDQDEATTSSTVASRELAQLGDLIGTADRYSSQASEERARLLVGNDLSAMESIIQITAQLFAAANFEELYELILDYLEDEFQPQAAVIFIKDLNQKKLKPLAYRLATAASSGKVHVSHSIIEQVVREKKAIICMDSQSDDRFSDSRSMILQEIRSAMATPIFQRNEIIGLLYLDSRTSEKLYQQEHLKKLCEMASLFALAIEFQRVRELSKWEHKMRERLQRYNSENVVKRLLTTSTGIWKQLIPEEKTITILFADLMGFTTWCGSRDRFRVSLLLNEHFAEMNKIIFQFAGTLDKFIGDAIMAIFGAPMDVSNHAEKAVRAALSMQVRLQKMNQNRPDEDRFQMRIGVNSGQVIAGDVGSPQRMEYTVLGAPVNIASRLESEVANAGDVIISEETKDLVLSAMRLKPLGQKNLKGVHQPVTAYRVVEIEEALPEPLAETIKPF